MIGVQSISMLEGAFERTRAYTKDRMVFGKPLIQLQVIFYSKKMRLKLISDYSTPIGRSQNRSICRTSFL